MEHKKLPLIVASAAGAVLLLCVIVIVSGVKFLRGKIKPTPAERILITRCDTDPSGLCVISFGADQLNRMVINLQLPGEDFPEFYAHVEHQDDSLLFTCNRVEVEPTSAYCLGPRTPLGEAIHLVLFTSDGDQLLAEGDFMVAALILPTFPNGTGIASTEETNTILPSSDMTETPTSDLIFPPTSGSRTPNGTRSPRPTPTKSRTPTPPAGYP